MEKAETQYLFIISIIIDKLYVCVYGYVRIHVSIVRYVYKFLAI